MTIEENYHRAVWLWPFMAMMKVSTNDWEHFVCVFLSLPRYENGHCPPEKGTRFKGKGSFFKHHFSGAFAVSSWGVSHVFQLHQLVESE